MGSRFRTAVCRRYVGLTEVHGNQVWVVVEQAIRKFLQLVVFCAYVFALRPLGQV